VERVVFPEIEAATELADRMTWPNVLDFIPIDPEYSVAEIAVPDVFMAKTLAETNLRRRYGVSVVAMKDSLTGKLDVFPDGAMRLSDSQLLVVVGKQAEINRLRELR
jgi:trk system potassium uptake protein TrkA